MKCECPYTLKVPMGNAFQVLFPVKTAEWKDGERTVEVADVRALTDIVVKVDGEEWQDWEMDERGPLVNFPKDSLAKGPHNVEVTADYFGVAIRAAYFECITMVQWSYESNIGNYIIGSPLVAEAAYIYVGITDDEELEALKQQYREATAACETARLEYEAAKEEFDEKAEQLDDVAQQTTLVEGIASVLQGFAPLATTEQLNTVAQDILTAISHIDIDTTTLAKEQTLNAVSDKIGQYGDTGRNPSVFGVLNEIWEQINAEDGHVVDMLHGVMNSLIAPDAIVVNNVEYKFNAAGGHVTTTDFNYTAWVSNQNNTIYLRNDDVVHVGSIAYAQPDFSAAVVGTVTSVVTTTKSEILAAIDSMADGYTLGSIVTILNGMWGDNQPQASLSSILAAFGNIDFSALAKQGDGSHTLTEVYEKVNELTALDGDLLTGKTQLAAQITAKGVPSTIQDGLTTMATKIGQIPQQLNTRTSDFEQMIAPSPYMWNVYSVATDLMKNTLPDYFPAYMQQYKQGYGANAFFVGEYYRGYASLELTGADGYLTHDGCFYTIANGMVTRTAPDGTTTTYAAESIVHTWLNSTDDIYTNRWVAFFYLADGYGFTNANANICPRRVAICGNCTSFVVSGANRLTDVWVIGELSMFNGGTNGTSWNKSQVIRNLKQHASGYIFNGASQLTNIVLPDTEKIIGGAILNLTSNLAEDLFVLCNATEIASAAYNFFGIVYCTSAVLTKCAPKILWLPKLKTFLSSYLACYSAGSGNRAFRGCYEIYMDSIEEIPSGKSIFYTANNAICENLQKLYMPSLKRIYGRITSGTNSAYYNYTWNYLLDLIDIEVGELETNLDTRWNPTNVLADATKKAQLIDNIKNHILARVSDRTGLLQRTFTVSTNMFNAISSETITWNEQTMTLADAFLTKNWLLAGA